MMMVTTWDLVDHRWDDGDGLTPLDPGFESNLADSYAAVTDELLGLGAGSVAWIVPPIPNVWWGNQGTGQEDPARHAVLRSVIDGLAASHPGQVSVIDLRRLARRAPGSQATTTCDLTASTSIRVPRYASPRTSSASA